MELWLIYAPALVQEVEGKDTSGGQTQSNGRDRSGGDLDRRPRLACAGKGRRRYTRRKGGEGMAERDSAGRPRLGIEGREF